MLNSYFKLTLEVLNVKKKVVVINHMFSYPLIIKFLCLEETSQ